MKFDDKIKQIRYLRFGKDYTYPGSLCEKMYSFEKNDISVDFKGIYDLNHFTYRKFKQRDFLWPSYGV